MKKNNKIELQNLKEANRLLFFSMEFGAFISKIMRFSFEKELRFTVRCMMVVQKYQRWINK